MFLEKFSGTPQREKDAAHSRESEPGETETKKVLREFAAFVQKHQKRISRELEQKKPLSDIIYDSFYTEDIDHPRYQEGEPQFETTRITYQREAARVLNRFLDLSRQYEGQQEPPIAPGKKSIENGWVYFKTFGGTNPNMPRGRFYLNINPEKLVSFYEEAVTAFANDGLPIEAKISQTANPEDVNRYDTMVIYFDETYGAHVLETLDVLHRKHAAIFTKGHPKFSAPLADSHGKTMTGIAFGEEPDARQGGQSFGHIRSQILTEVYRAAAKERFPLSDRRAIKAFETACKNYGVDPKNAAFNARVSNQRSFSAIKRRTSPA